MDVYEIIILSLAVSSASVTIAVSNSMEWLRSLFVAIVSNIHDGERVENWARGLIHCPYCLSHWLAAIATLACVKGSMSDLVMTGFAIVTIASLASVGIIHLFLALDALDRSE